MGGACPERPHGATARRANSETFPPFCRPQQSWPGLETTSSVSPRGDTSDPSLSGLLPLSPLPGAEGSGCRWRPVGQVGFPGETTVEAEEEAAATATPVSSTSKEKRAGSARVRPRPLFRLGSRSWFRGGVAVRGRDRAWAAVAAGGGPDGLGPPPPPAPSHNGPAGTYPRDERPALALPLRPRRLGGALLSGLLSVPLCLCLELPPRGSPRDQSLTGTCPWGSGYGNRSGSKSTFQNRPASDLSVPAGLGRAEAEADGVCVESLGVV